MPDHVFVVLMGRRTDLPNQVEVELVLDEAVADETDQIVSASFFALLLLTLHPLNRLRRHAWDTRWVKPVDQVPPSRSLIDQTGLKQSP